MKMEDEIERERESENIKRRVGKEYRGNWIRQGEVLVDEEFEGSGTRRKG